MKLVAKDNKDNLLNIPNVTGSIFTKEKLQQLSKQLEGFYEKRQCFMRHHSQFMDCNLILSKVTPLRNARQALAHIETSFQAIKQNEYKIKKQQIEIQMINLFLLLEAMHLLQE